MISNQPSLPSKAGAALAVAPGEPSRPSAAESGAAGAFAALLGQHYQPPPPQASSPKPVATMKSDAPAEAQQEPPVDGVVTLAAPVEPMPVNNPLLASPDEAAPSVLPPPVFTPRAPRAVTAAITAALRQRADELPSAADRGTLAVAATLKAAPSDKAEQAAHEEQAAPGQAAAQAAAQASIGAALAAAALAQPTPVALSTPAPAKTSSESPAAPSTDGTAGSEATSGATGHGAPARTDAPGTPAAAGLATSSPMVRAMTMLLDALGVTDRKSGSAPSEKAVPKGASEPAPSITTASDLQPTTTVIGGAPNHPVLSDSASEANAKPPQPVEPTIAEPLAPPGAVVTRTPGSDQGRPSGQGDRQERRDGHEESRHRLDASAAPAAAEPSPSSWSSALSSEMRPGTGIAVGGDTAPVGAAAYVPRSDPAPAAASTSQVTMDLDPAVGVLGKIRVAVRGDAVFATITTQNTDATALGQRAHELRQALEQRGFNDARVTVRTPGTDDAPAAVIATSVSDLRPRDLAPSSSAKSNSDSQQQPRGERRDQAGGDRSDTRRQRNRQEQTP